MSREKSQLQKVYSYLYISFEMTKYRNERQISDCQNQILGSDGKDMDVGIKGILSQNTDHDSKYKNPDKGKIVWDLIQIHTQAYR